MKTMARTSAFLLALALAPLSAARAQYAPPPPPAPFQGFVNKALRKNGPDMNKWDLGGALRVRYEAKEGFGIPGVAGSLDFRDHGADVNNEYFLERIRYRIGYTEKWWSMLVEGRSSFVQDDQRFAYFASPLPPSTVNRNGLGPESDQVDLHQAYLTLGNPKEFPLSLKVGRQELSFGEERLVGAFAWNNLGRVFDAVKLRWQTEWFGADFFASRVVIPEDLRFNVGNDYDWFSGFYATSTKIPKNLLDVYFFARNASQSAISAEPSPQAPQPGARDIYTVGSRLKSKPGAFGNWDYLIDGAYQFGNFRDRRLGSTSARLEHDAFMLIANGGYTIASAWATPRFALEYAYGSGDSNPTNATHETFENLFPTNHKFYGYMDFISLQNLHDVRGILQLKPHPRLSLVVEGHGFWLADTHDNFYNVGGAPRGGTGATAGDNYGVNPTYSAFLGTEVDVIGGWAVTPYAQLEAGYGHFFTGDYVRQSLSAATHGARDADWVYVQLNVNF